mmetsp:Transcript_17696/g.30790  ORF Transcript_17696/g.30790 Transcript_17696/m.30790 type:complete len:253 (-) Transcript_17696:549-1307(-)
MLQYYTQYVSNYPIYYSQVKDHQRMLRYEGHLRKHIKNLISNVNCPAPAQNLSDGATFFAIRSSEFLLINPVLVFLVNRVPHIPCGGVLGLDVAREILEIQLRMRIIVQLAAKDDPCDASQLVGRKLTLVQKIELLDGDPELTQALNGLSVGQPGVLRVDFFSLATQVVQHVHAQLELLVDVVPVVDNVLLIRAQPNHHPHRQVLQRRHGFGNVAVTGLSVCGDDQTGLLTRGTKLALDLSDLLDHLADVSA